MSEEPRRSFRFSFGLDRLGLIALKAPYVSAALILLLTIAAVFGVMRLRVDDSLSELFRTDTKEFRQYEEIDRRFPSSEYDVLVVVDGKRLLERDNLHRGSGEPGRSLVELERAQTILSRELSPDDTRLALAQGRLSTVYGELGRHQEAVAHARAAMRTFDARLPPDSPNRVLVLRSFAGVLSAAGEHGEALDRLRAAQRLADRVLPATHRDRLGIHVDLVGELVANGVRDEAIAAARGAIAMMPGVVDPPERATSLPELLRQAQALPRSRANG